MGTKKDSFIARQIVQISAILNNYDRTQSNGLPDGIKQMIINFNFFWIVCDAAFQFILHRNIQSENTYKLRAAINFIIKQIQLRFDPEHYNADKNVRFHASKYIEYKSYKLNLEQITDITIDFIHLAYIHELVSAEDIGGYLAHWRTFVDDTSDIEADYTYNSTFMIAYLTKRGLAEYTTSTLNNDKNLLKTFRYFANDCEFKFPGEARMIERLLEGFAEFYSKMHYNEHGGIWNDTDALFVAVNALLMYSTSQHNPRIKERDKLKMSVFKGMCQGIKINGKPNQYFADQMVEMALEIQKTPIRYTKFT